MLCRGPPLPSAHPAAPWPLSARAHPAPAAPCLAPPRSPATAATPLRHITAACCLRTGAPRVPGHRLAVPGRTRIRLPLPTLTPTPPALMPPRCCHPARAHCRPTHGQATPSQHPHAHVLPHPRVPASTARVLPLCITPTAVAVAAGALVRLAMSQPGRGTICSPVEWGRPMIINANQKLELAPMSMTSGPRTLNKPI